jgi:hypothetical protein
MLLLILYTKMHIGLVTVFITSNYGGQHHTSHANYPWARASVNFTTFETRRMNPEVGNPKNSRIYNFDIDWPGKIPRPPELSSTLTPTSGPPMIANTVIPMYKGSRHRRLFSNTPRHCQNFGGSSTWGTLPYSTSCWLTVPTTRRCQETSDR